MDGSLPSTAYGNTKVILNSYLPGHQQQHQSPSSSHYDPNNAYQNESLYQPYQQLAHPPQLPPPPLSDHHHHHHHQQQQQQQHHQLSNQLNQLSLQDGPIPMQHPHQHQHQPQPPRNVGGVSMMQLTARSPNVVAEMNNPPPQALQQAQQSAALPESNSFFVSDFVKEEILKRLVKSQELPSQVSLHELPARVDVYIELLALEPSPGAASYSFNGMASSVYRATNSETGQLVCLRRFHSFTPSTANAKLLMATIDSWKKLAHANIVPLRQVFTTKAFGDNSVIFVYDYYPASETLMGAYFANQQLQPPNSGGGSSIGNSHVGGNGVAAPGSGGINGPGGSQSGPQSQQQQQHQLSTNGYSTASRPYSQQAQNTRKLLPEATIWNYIIQISSALRTIHQSNLACRALDPSKVLLTSGWSTNANNAFSNRGRNARLRLAFAGVPDILTLDAFLHHSTNMGGNPRALVAHFQQEDLLLFGRLCLALASNNLAAFSLPASAPPLSGLDGHLLAECLDLVPRSYSNDLRTLIGYLLSVKSATAVNNPMNKALRSIDDIMPMIGARFYMQLDHLYYRYDHLYEELAKEADNGRLLRLLAKLGTINERPEHQLDPNWSETGDRYMLKLFRDYLFHQCDEEGRPWLDLGHIITNLNKMDIGSGEKICLVSRDAQNVIIVSFEELKRCFEAALADLMQ